MQNVESLRTMMFFMAGVIIAMSIANLRMSSRLYKLEDIVFSFISCFKVILKDGEDDDDEDGEDDD